MNWTFGNHNIKFGGEFKKHQFDTNLPEEQATEFEKFDNFTQLITGNATEADTQYGITDKSFRFMDYGLYFTETWKVNRKLSITRRPALRAIYVADGERWTDRQL